MNDFLKIVLRLNKQTFFCLEQYAGVSNIKILHFSWYRLISFVVSTEQSLHYCDCYYADCVQAAPRLLNASVKKRNDHKRSTLVYFFHPRLIYSFYKSPFLDLLHPALWHSQLLAQLMSLPFDLQKAHLEINLSPQQPASHSCVKRNSWLNSHKPADALRFQIPPGWHLHWRCKFPLTSPASSLPGTYVTPTCTQGCASFNFSVMKDQRPHQPPELNLSGWENTLAITNSSILLSHWFSVRPAPQPVF